MCWKAWRTSCRSSGLSIFQTWTGATSRVSKWSWGTTRTPLRAKETQQRTLPKVWLVRRGQPREKGLWQPAATATQCRVHPWQTRVLRKWRPRETVFRTTVQWGRSHPPSPRSRIPGCGTGYYHGVSFVLSMSPSTSDISCHVQQTAETESTMRANLIVNCGSIRMHVPSPRLLGEGWGEGCSDTF